MSQHKGKVTVAQGQGDDVLAGGRESNNGEPRGDRKPSDPEELTVQPKRRPRITRADVDVSQEYAAGMGLSVKPTEISMRRPYDTEWTRVRDGEEWTATLALVEVKLDNRTETYLIWGEQAPLLKSMLARYIRFYQVYVCINRDESVFLWLCKLPASRFDTRGESWTKSRWEAVAILKHAWGQVYIPDRGGAVCSRDDINYRCAEMAI